MSDITWHDAMQWPFEGSGWTHTLRHFDRLPGRAESCVDEAVWGLSRMSAGLSLRFTTDARDIHARYDLLLDEISMSHMPATGHSGLDLYAEDEEGIDRWVGIARPESRQVNVLLAEGLAPGQRRYTLYLPLYNSPETLEIGVPAGARIEPLAARSEKPIVFYGTSIMHGASAARCGMAFPAQLSRRLGGPVLNLGFAGNGRMQAEVVDLLAELEASVFVIDCLPNMTADLVAEHSKPLVERLRLAHPRTPILLVEDRTYGNTRFYPDKAQRHRDSRAALRATWRELVDAGDDNLHYLQGSGLLPADGEATVDSSHPTDLGMVAYADAYERALRPILHLP
jgi:hypothetical protein